MTPTLVIDPEAQAEFDQGYDHYEGVREGLGEDFADAVEKVLLRIAKTPRLHAVVFGTVRRAVVARFPYCIYYRDEGGRVRVISIFFAKRDPAVWQARASD